MNLVSQEKMNQEVFLSVEEVSKVLDFSPQYIRKLLREGKLSGQRVGKTWVVSSTVVDAFDRNSHLKENSDFDRQSSIVRKNRKPIVLSFFSGAMGLDIGLEKAGFQTLLACEIDKAGRKTIIANNPNIGLIGDIRNYTAEEILSYAGLTRDTDIDVIAGGPPCQAFSTAGKRNGFQDERGNVFLKYLEVIEELRPRFVVIENVRGLLSTKMTIDVDDEISREMTPTMRETSGAALYYIKRRLENAGYGVSFNLYNSANFGSPQIRERVVLLCSRSGDILPHLTPTHDAQGEHGLKKWNTFKKAVKDLPTECDHIQFPEKRLKYYRMLKPGENWRNLPAELQPQALGKSYYLGGGKTGFFRRLSWDRPAPTLVTHPAMPATDLAHPELDRPLSVQEYKRVQEFPDSWIIEGSILDRYKQIGNAVPVSLGKAVGLSLMNALNNQAVDLIDDFKYSRYNKTSDIQWTREYHRLHEKQAQQLLDI
ncbi:MULTISPECIES: DNA cytosine methyltransferase [Sphingobacterium]|uniref:DNA cytosine methyltransferase n=1 Tax=Sphingobacterium TaxID=28453 RepID=UPI001F096385|nr:MULTISPECIES: DNA cytosine methyltransferase [unclassified Sphingobacterium]